jgi:hypothetical protein
MALFSDKSAEAAAYHTCRSAPQNEPLVTDELAKAGAYAASLAWSGHVTGHGQPETFEHACHIGGRAATAFIEQTAKDHAVDPDDLDAAKKAALARFQDELRTQYA